jgi:hypothetical protein
MRSLQKDRLFQEAGFERPKPDRGVAKYLPKFLRVALRIITS